VGNAIGTGSSIKEPSGSRPFAPSTAVTGTDHPVIVASVVWQAGQTIRRFITDILIENEHIIAGPAYPEPVLSRTGRSTPG